MANREGKRAAKYFARDSKKYGYKKAPNARQVKRY